MSTTQAPNADAILARTERAGLRLVLIIRSAIVFLWLSSILLTQGIERGIFGASIAAVFLVIGLAYLAVVIAERDRTWMRYAFVALDLGLLAYITVAVPLSQTGDVPQILVFRIYNMGVFYFILATSALSLSPGLVLWTGAGAIAAVWGAWGWIVSGMDRIVLWSDFRNDPTAENYSRLVLDPDHINLAARIGDTVFITATALVTAAAVQRARTLLRRQMASERARAEVAEVFGRFVPEEVVETLSHSDGVLPPSEREATVMFVDIEGFTTVSESMAPHDLVELLDAFFDEVGTTAARHRGVCISLIGDAALVAFNAPLDNPDHAASGVACARDLLARTQRQTFAGRNLAIRIGLSTGQVAAATVGGQGRRSFTLYGDTVNQAQRLEQLNKERETQCLMSEDTWAAAGSPADTQAAGRVRLKGRSGESAIYALAKDGESVGIDSL